MSLRLTLEAIRDALDGGLPIQLASCGTDSQLAITEVDQLYFIGNGEIALHYRASDKLHDHLQQNPRLSALLTHPQSAVRYRLAIEYLRTETAGPVFEGLHAKWRCAAQPRPMLGVDVCRVLAIDALAGNVLPVPPAPCNRLAAVRQLSQRLAASDELSQAFDFTLDGLADQMGIGHALILCVDESGQWLYTVASRGYAESGVGSEVKIGEGMIGMVAQSRSAIRLNQLTARYSRPAIHTYSQPTLAPQDDIPIPSLHQPHSRLAVPIEAGNWLAGVLYVESADTRRLDFEDEDALIAIAQQLGLAMRWLTRPVETVDVPLAAIPTAPVVDGQSVTIRYVAATQSVFIEDEYLIKGVAGAVLWLLLNDFVQLGRSESNNRALRLDPRLKLPDFDDNLDTRLLLLQRRLSERCDWLGLEKLGRGRFRIMVTRSLTLIEVESA